MNAVLGCMWFAIGLSAAILGNVTGSLVCFGTSAVLLCTAEVLRELRKERT